VDYRRISTPLRVESKQEIELSESVHGRKRKIGALQFEVLFSFRGTKGDDLWGRGRLFVPKRRPRQHLPIIVSMHYEMDAKASARFLARGWAVLTPHGERSYQLLNLMGDGINHSLAMAQLPRRMPFVDQNHVMLFGGSAGGYHALMAASGLFPVTAVYAAVPILNLKYNIEYLVKNDRYNVNDQDSEKPAAPVVKAVLPIATETWKGGRPDKQSFIPFSPTFRTRLITFPTLITYSTADVLVPVNQLSKDLVQPPPEALWPAGFTFEIEKLVADEAERSTLLENLPPSDYYLKTVRVPRDSPTVDKPFDELTPEERLKIGEHTLQWSKRKRFSIFVLDEGYPEPFSGHVKYHHRIVDDGFFEYHMSRPGLGPSCLTMEKLLQIVKRFAEVEDDTGREFSDGESWTISRWDHIHIERWYIALGLEIFVRAGAENARRLALLYANLPEELKVLDRPEEGLALKKDPLTVLLLHEADSLERGGDKHEAELLRRKAEQDGR